MERRQVLAGVLSGLSICAGCLSRPGATGVAPVEDPPDWLQQTATCDYPKGVLHLSEDAVSHADAAAIVAYETLSEESKRLVRFAIQYQSAETCTDSGASNFDKLLNEITELAYRPYREEHDSRPPSFAIEAEDNYYRIEKMYAFDAVLV